MARADHWNPAVKRFQQSVGDEDPIISMARAAAVELGPIGIRVNLRQSRNHAYTHNLSTRCHKGG
jgi:hypothetical protein